MKALARILWPPRRYYRCNGCASLTWRRWRDQPAEHPCACSPDAIHVCGYWVAVSPGALIVRRAAVR